MIISAMLLICVGLMLSILGGRYLIRPILRRADLPVILGNERYARMTVWSGWHALSLVWWAQAAALLWLGLDPENARQALLLSASLPSALIGGAALIASRGRHVAWVFLLPVAAVIGAASLLG